jgi:hypothetical protein
MWREWFHCGARGPTIGYGIEHSEPLIVLLLRLTSFHTEAIAINTGRPASNLYFLSQIKDSPAIEGGTVCGPSNSLKVTS